MDRVRQRIAELNEVTPESGADNIAVFRQMDLILVAGSPQTPEGEAGEVAANLSQAA